MTWRWSEGLAGRPLRSTASRGCFGCFARGLAYAVGDAMTCRPVQTASGRIEPSRLRLFNYSRMGPADEVMERSRSLHGFYHRGNLHRIVNAAGAVTGSFEYNAWGEKLLNQPPAEGTRFGFSAPAWMTPKDDLDGALLLTPTRTYHAGVGRFLQKDPAIVNPFTFAGRRPDSGTMPTYFRRGMFTPNIGSFASRDPVALRTLWCPTNTLTVRPLRATIQVAANCDPTYQHAGDPCCVTIGGKVLNGTLVGADQIVAQHFVFCNLGVLALMGDLNTYSCTEHLIWVSNYACKIPGISNLVQGWAYTESDSEALGQFHVYGGSAFFFFEVPWDRWTKSLINPPPGSRVPPNVA